MSLTSCFKYAIELPEATLSALLRSMLGSAEAGGLPTTYEETGIVVGDYVVSVVAALVDSDAQPSSMEITATALQARLHLFMRIEVTVDDYEGLDPIVYQASFAVPGNFAVDTAVDPRMLGLVMGTLSPADLDVSLSGGELHFSAAAFEAPIHQMYVDHPELHSFWKMKTIAGQSRRVMVWVYDDAMNPITVELPNATTLRVHLPGKLEIWTALLPSTKESEATFSAAVDIAITDEIGGDGVRRIILKLGQVTAANVSVTLGWIGATPFYSPAVPGMMATEIADFFNDLDDEERVVPGQDEIREEVGRALAEFASNTVWAMFPLTNAGEIALADAVPDTVPETSLVLKVESELDVPCDALESFAVGTKLATAIGPVECQRRLDAAANKVDELPDQEIDGYDVTLNRPTMRLANPGEHDVADGHIWVEGSAVVHVGGCVGDVDVNYRGPLTLTVHTAADGTVTFDVVAGDFAGDADGKKDKGNWDPDAIRSYIEALDWDFPSVPARFDGRFDLHVDFNEVSIDRRGIVVSGALSVVTVNQAMSSSMRTSSAYWASEGAHGG